MMNKATVSYESPLMEVIEIEVNSSVLVNSGGLENLVEGNYYDGDDFDSED